MRHLAAGIFRFGGLTPGWTAATTTALGHGPWQPLGRVFDTRPDECPLQLEVHEALKPVAAPGGLVLRAQYPSSLLEAERFGAYGALAIQLYVASWDRFDRDAVPATWPGPKANAGHDFTWPFPEDYDAGRMDDAVKAWAVNVIARNVLDVAPYLATAGAEVDLGELGGGGRYVLAFWRAVYVRDTGDALAAVSVAVPWSLRSGRAAASCHRDRWCATVAIRSPRGMLASASDLETGDVLARKVGVFSPPIGGVAGVCAKNGHNTLELYVMLEEWLGGPTQRKLTNWMPLVAFEAKEIVTRRVCGALVVYAGTNAPDDTTAVPSLITIEVVQ